MSTELLFTDFDSAASPVYIATFLRSTLPETVCATTAAIMVTGQGHPNALLYLPSVMFVATLDIKINAAGPRKRTGIRVTMVLTQLPVCFK